MPFNRKYLVIISIILQQIIGNHSLIIPDEVPSLLSVIYSNIPTIKKGTDSRLGWGFRLGNRADFQILLELGPQLNTQPLGNQPDNNNNNNKRNTIDSLSNELYAKRQREKHERQQFEQLKKQQQQQQDDEKQVADNDGAGWLKLWHKSITKHRNSAEELPLEPRPGLGIGEIDAKSVIPDDSVLDMEEVYRKSDKNQINSTLHKDQKQLDDVSLE